MLYQKPQNNQINVPKNFKLSPEKNLSILSSDILLENKLEFNNCPLRIITGDFMNVLYL